MKNLGPRHRPSQRRRVLRLGLAAAIVAGAVLAAPFGTQVIVSGQSPSAAPPPSAQRGEPVLARSGVFAGSVKSLPILRPWQMGDPTEEAERATIGEPGARLGPEYPAGKPLAQAEAGATLDATPLSFTTPAPNFDGIPATGFTPPDTNGDIGPNHYIQAVNASFQIFDRQGNSLAGPSAINSLFATMTGTPCGDRNRGDPIVNYDHLADRWMISQFTGLRDGAGVSWPTHHQCFAISRGPDPVNDGWYVYDFLMNDGADFWNDYPKIGIWPDGYYMGSQRGFPDGGLDVFAFDRASMLNGNPATMQRFFVSGKALFLLPADLDGPAPAPGTPIPFIRHVDGDLWGGADRLEMYAFHVDWGVPANSTFTGPTSLPTAPFSADCGGGGGLNQNCITQPGTANTVDSLATWIMWRLQFRDFGDHQSMVVNHTIDVDGADHAGVRWYELRNTGAGWSIHQEGTFAPDANAPGLADDPHRFMGSIAMDSAGNIALGYAASTSNATFPVFPEVRYAGRLASDPLDLLPHGEVTLQAGAGSQTGSQRYGDYSAMQVDPVDGCTFWYTQEYIVAGGGWRTRIGAFRFSSCNQADVRISKSATPNPALAGASLFYNITVTNDGPGPASAVTVVDTLPTGVTFVTSTDSCVATPPPAGELTCSLGSLASGASKSFTIQVSVSAGLVALSGAASLTNTAVVSADEEDPDTSNNTASVTTLVEERADLLLTKQCKPDGPLPSGGTATCTILVQNLGPSDARSVVVTDTHVSSGAFVISSATFDPPAGSACGIAAGVVTCSLGTEPAGGLTTITVQITSNDQVDVNDTARVASATPDPDTSNNLDEGHVSFTGLSNLSISKADAPDPVVAGTNLTYTISVGNAGPSVAPNVVVRDTLPSQFAVISVAVGGGAGSCINGIPGDPLQPLTCTLGSLASGGSRSITIVGTVNPATPEGTILNNNARVSSSNADPDNSNNSFSATTTVQARADLAIFKTSDKPTYKPSSIITYTVKVTNNGASNAQAVIVTDTLPAMRSAIYQRDTGGCTTSANILTCNMGDMAVGESKSFNIYLLIKGNRGAISNTVSVSSATVDLVPGNNSATLVVQVK